MPLSSSQCGHRRNELMQGNQNKRLCLRFSSRLFNLMCAQFSHVQFPIDDHMFTYINDTIDYCCKWIDPFTLFAHSKHSTSHSHMAVANICNSMCVYATAAIANSRASICSRNVFTNLLSRTNSLIFVSLFLCLSVWFWFYIRSNFQRQFIFWFYYTEIHSIHLNHS